MFWRIITIIEERKITFSADLFALTTAFKQMDCIFSTLLSILIINETSQCCVFRMRKNKRGSPIIRRKNIKTKNI